MCLQADDVSLPADGFENSDENFELLRCKTCRLNAMEDGTRGGVSVCSRVLIRVVTRRRRAEEGERATGHLSSTSALLMIALSM
jgi:hypothetical protein